jgi:hypothetical protein
MKCEGFSSLVQSQPEMIKRDRSKQKYSYVKRRVTVPANREDLF